MLGGHEKRKSRKRSEEKVMGFSSTTPFPTRKREGGDQEKRKARKTRKSRNEEKVMGFRLATLLLAMKREAVTQGGNHGDRQPDVEENPASRAGIIKD